MSAAKEYHRLRRNIAGLTDGQASMGEVDWESGRLDRFKVTISPSSGPYKGGNFVFSVRLQEDYPTHIPPLIYCITKVKHPNIYDDVVRESGDGYGNEEFSDEEEEAFESIHGRDDSCDIYYEKEEEFEDDYDGKDEDTNVCLNLFNDGVWNPSFGLESVVLGLLFLMHNPNFDSPLNEECEYMNEEARSEYIGNYMHELLAKQSGGADKASTETKEETETTVSDIPMDAPASQNDKCADAYKQSDTVVIGEQLPVSISEDNTDTLLTVHDGATDVNSVKNSEPETNNQESLLNSSVQDSRTSIEHDNESRNTITPAESKTNDALQEMDNDSKETNICDTETAQMNDTEVGIKTNSENKFNETDEQTAGNECNEDKVSTRLMAFEGGFVLIGGCLNSHLQHIDTCLVNNEPVTTESVNGEYVSDEPVNNEQVTTEPVNGELVSDEPVNNEQVTTEPVNGELVSDEPVNNEQVTTEPVNGGSVSDEPVNTESVNTEQVKFESVIVESASVEPAIAEPVKVEPVLIEEVQVEAIIVEPVIIEPVNDKPANVELVNVELVKVEQ